MAFLRDHQMMAGDPGRHHWKFGRALRKLNMRRFHGLGGALGAFGVPGAGLATSIFGDPGRKPLTKGHSARRGHPAARHGHVPRAHVAKHGGHHLDVGKLAGALAGGVPIAGGALQELGAQLGVLPGAGATAEPLGLPGLHGFGRRRRSMHVTNPKALRRAMRRVEGFAKLARRTMTFIHHHKLKKRGKGRR